MKNLLPNGSVVQLSVMEHRVMIYGRIQRDAASGQIFDYAGCLYPEGMQNSNSVMLFNNEDIDMVYFIGFQDVEELAYRSALGELAENGKNNDLKI